MNQLISDANGMELDYIELKATDEGYHFAKSLGFQDTESKYHNMKKVL